MLFRKAVDFGYQFYSPSPCRSLFLDLWTWGDFLRRHPCYLGVVVALSHPCAFTVFPPHFIAWACRAVLDGMWQGVLILFPISSQGAIVSPCRAGTDTGCLVLNVPLRLPGLEANKEIKDVPPLVIRDMQKYGHREVPACPPGWLKCTEASAQRCKWRSASETSWPDLQARPLYVTQCVCQDPGQDRMATAT